MKKIKMTGGLAMALFWGGVVVLFVILKLFVFTS